MELIFLKMDNRMREALKMENKGGESIDIRIEMFIKGSGKMILNKERGRCIILIRINIKENGEKERKMVGGSIGTITERFMKVIL
jgi:hypothetical protein